MDVKNIEKLIFDQMLHAKVKLDLYNILDFLNREGKFYHYCPFYEDITIFTKNGYNLTEEEDRGLLEQTFEYYSESYFSESSEKYKFGKIVLTCTHNINHSLYFYYIFTENEIVKIGQYPDFEKIKTNENIEMYREILGNEKYEELSKAIGLEKTGLALPALTYLRRIIENIILNAKEKALSENKLDEEKFEGERYDERIRMLSDYLPKSLVEKKSLYSILSMGIHQLTNEDAVEIFDIIFDNLKDILDEVISKKEYDNALNDVTENLKQIVSLQKEI